MRTNNQKEPGRLHPFIIPVFIMNRGCPHRCVYCNQKITAGDFPSEMTKEFFDHEVNSWLARNKNKERSVEIAFYGGTFTGNPLSYQKKLLSWAQYYIQRGDVHSIRISTRPDCISQDNLSELKKFGVVAVELGAQSFVDEVLSAAQRGHDANSIVQAMKILKDGGFRTGLHLMAGLPGDNKQGFLYSIQKTTELDPDTVRIHPAIVFGGTTLARDYAEGRYKPLELSEAVELCRLAWEKLAPTGIRVIRMGVQVTDEMEKEGSVIAGPFHPALGNLVMSAVFYDRTVQKLRQMNRDARELRFDVSERDISNFRGLKNENITLMKKLYPDARIIVRSVAGHKRGMISVGIDAMEPFKVEIPGFSAS